MERKHIVLIVFAVTGVVVAIFLKSYLSPERVIERSLLSAIAAFEQEQILGAIKPISRGYNDRWGQSYESLAGNIREAQDTFDELEVTLEPPSITVEGEEATLRMKFVVWGSAEGTRGYVIGTITDPCTATLRWKKETPGWRIITIDELDIPEFREELREASS